ncbi:BspA family leucine-rich repeat surface protein [Mycoplasma mycoides]|uniref:BspA family leucine-rich repeat surface protein n=1 Tax=Mycoplasma mycoides subsp. capri LC str. 95010 TaxID=862259 RepID=F4MP18_MYCML|nr:BspA family leucine-rich repeat surface protein [Mycoplasma mycoides]QVK06956.1 DUF285 domain-containing protein [Mycoplasma mycoides subsp. capri]CBW53850.1 Conserved hypothetical protein, predicted transmembrane protein, DUF285 family [Mycoplasma mycoides subsp. capri LC str. 95010]
MKKLMVVLTSFFVCSSLFALVSFLDFNNNLIKLSFNEVKKESQPHEYQPNNNKEIKTIGFFKKDGKITIRPIPWYVEKVTSTLPSEIESLYGAFANRFEHHGKVTGFENWNTENITDMSYVFYNNQIVNVNVSSWKTDKVTNMKGMFKGAIKFNNDDKPLDWKTDSVTDMESMFDGATSFNQKLNGWNVDKVDNNKNFSRGSGFWNEPNKRPKWKTPEINDEIVKKENTNTKEIIHKSPEKPKVKIPWTKIVTPARKIHPELKSISKPNITTLKQETKKLSTPAIVGIVVGSQVVLTSLAAGIPYLIKRFKK